MDLRIQLRWLVKEDSRVLQYRQQYMQTHYSQVDPQTQNYVKLPEWGHWQNVPEQIED